MSKVLKIEQLQWRLVLSGLWIYFFLNILFRDVHEFFRTGFLEQALAGVVNGNVVTEEVLLYSAIGLQIPLLMTVLSRLLSDSMNRWFNLLVSTFMFVGIVVFNRDPDLDDIVFVCVEALALVAIFGLAWRGPRVATNE